MKKLFFILTLYIFQLSFNIQFHEHILEFIAENEESKFDTIYSDYITDTKSKNYTYTFDKPTVNPEKIYFDYQSEYGCINITFSDEKKFNFCSEGKNNLFEIKYKDLQITEKSFNVQVGYNEIEKSFPFEYSLKVSLKKELNIFEVNSEKKLLCKTETIEQRNNSCLFIILNNKFEQNKDLIIYAKPQNSTKKLNIYAKYINSQAYFDMDTRYLKIHIPNNESEFTNNEKKTDFIIVPNLKIENFTYLKIEAEEESTIEIIVQTLLKNDEIELSTSKNLQLFQLNNKNKEIPLSPLKIFYNNNMEISVVTLYGKMSTVFDAASSRTFINDVIDNKLTFSVDLKNNHHINITHLNESVDDEFGCIFYISYKWNLFPKIKEIDFITSNKIIIKNDLYNQLILFSQLPDTGIDTSYNINLQLYYDIKNEVKVSSVITTQEQLYRFKVGNIGLDNLGKVTNTKFNPIFSSVNIHIPNKVISKLDKKNKWLLMVVTVNETFKEFILGTTISQLDSQLYAAERIYHFGNLGDNYPKTVYRLRGVKCYHLMRLEFSANDGGIKWTVKRTNSQTDYMKNDTDLSFVTEKFANGRELLTMYIENGEDIYLTIFYTKKVKNAQLTNYVFKYINAKSNLDFTNYILKNDNFTTPEDSEMLTVKTIKKIKPGSTITYYLGVIKEIDYVKYESLNTIGLPSSSYSYVVKGKKYNKGNMGFTAEFERRTTYFVNSYARIISKENDVENFAYSYYIIEGIEFSQASRGLIIASIVLFSGAIIVIIIRFFKRCDDY